MSDILKAAHEALSRKVGPGQLDFSVKVMIENEGAIRLDADGATVDDSDADVTLIADADTFRQISEGALNPTTAFMSGRMRIEGDMGLAMRLGSVLG
ncbi:sterol carrier family protein [Halovulum dunhuangense]|uniref:Sterol carrier family protein n=1 Tax=Halovulum dunhuangense TaxID=1505036 RepID=A0A849L5E1_9RHOB|nr:SCP2 sterol-binding domain-containing protein [Halovulum dunhuangense]NNU81400.1 sterol carrier family protein [Halovulum dunhuangense]